MHYVYLLRLKGGNIYVGSARNLQSRVIKHQKGDVKSTKGLRPVKIIFYCAFTSKTKAEEFENYLKTGSGWAFRNRHLI